jgi:hypothetical protein
LDKQNSFNKFGKREKKKMKIKTNKDTLTKIDEIFVEIINEEMKNPENSNELKEIYLNKRRDICLTLAKNTIKTNKKEEEEVEPIDEMKIKQVEKTIKEIKEKSENIEKSRERLLTEIEDYMKFQKTFIENYVLKSNNIEEKEKSNVDLLNHTTVQGIDETERLYKDSILNLKEFMNKIIITKENLSKAINATNLKKRKFEEIQNNSSFSFSVDEKRINEDYVYFDSKNNSKVKINF